MTKIFYSYCHDEENHLKTLRKEVAIVVQNAEANEWYDRNISGGQDLSVIFQNLQNSDIILLLLSPGYLASSSCRREMEMALERRKNEGIYVLPIVVKRCGWKEHDELRNILAIPTDGKPIVEWSVSGKAWEVVRTELKTTIEALKSSQLDQYFPRQEFRRKIGEIFFVQHGNHEIDIEDIFGAPCKGAIPQRVRIPPGNCRSSR